MSYGHRYTDEQIEWLKQNRPQLTINELSVQFNERFGASVKPRALLVSCGRHGILSGKDGRFKKNNIPWNLGKTGYMGANKTSFGPGNKPQTYRPVGSVRMTKDSSGREYAEIKTKDPRTWEAYHRIIYRKAYGPIPRGHVVIFKDGNTRNLHYANLVAVKRSELARLQIKRYSQQPQELRDSVLAVVKVEQRIKELQDA